MLKTDYGRRRSGTSVMNNKVVAGAAEPSDGGRVLWTGPSLTGVDGVSCAHLPAASNSRPDFALPTGSTGSTVESGYFSLAWN